MTFQAWKIPLLNSMTFQYVWNPCVQHLAESAEHKGKLFQEADWYIISQCITYSAISNISDNFHF